RVGRAVTGTGEIIRDIVVSGQSILLLGRPGIGKTTMLRECARLLADELRKRVVIVDTSNEIGGDGDIPHPGIGRARRMQVRTPLLERKAPPTFDVLVEIQDRDRVAIHMPLAEVVDTALRGPMQTPKIRVRTREGRVISNVDVPTLLAAEPEPATVTINKPLGIFPY